MPGRAGTYAICHNPPMIQVEIRPVVRFRAGDEREFDFRMVPLLEGLESTGKLTRAAQHAGMSYRHAWNLIEQWTSFFGAPLVEMEKGRGTHLTALGRNLLWAGKRAQARLDPTLANLASELARALNDALNVSGAHLCLHASHDFAIAGLGTLGLRNGLAIDIHYEGSFDALARLTRGACDVAGFHIAEGPLSRLMARRYTESLDGDRHVLIAFVSRTQGLIVRAGNPKRIAGVSDLARDDVRIVNRQRGSGTRALLEFQLSRDAVDRTRIRGYDSEEVTHSAVAAHVASDLADVGPGVAEAAVQYRLDFVPTCTERYYFAVPRAAVQSPALRAFCDLLRSADVRALVESLAGYACTDIGTVVEVSRLADLAEPSVAA